MKKINCSDLIIYSFSASEELRGPSSGDPIGPTQISGNVLLDSAVNSMILKQQKHKH